MAEEYKCNQVDRLGRIESDMRELKETDKESTKSIINVEKSNAKTEVYFEQIYGMLKESKATVEETLRKLTVTEDLAKNLKIVTDGLTKDLKAITLKVIAIEEKPSKNYEKLKWVLISFIVSNLFGLMGIIYKVMSAK